MYVRATYIERERDIEITKSLPLGRSALPLPCHADGALKWRHSLLLVTTSVPTKAADVWGRRRFNVQQCARLALPTRALLHVFVPCTKVNDTKRLMTEHSC